MVMYALQMLEAVLDVCNKGARIAACGMISDYNKKDKYGITNLFNVSHCCLVLSAEISRKTSAVKAAHDGKCKSSCCLSHSGSPF